MTRRTVTAGLRDWTTEKKREDEVLLFSTFFVYFFSPSVVFWIQQNKSSLPAGEGSEPHSALHTGVLGYGDYECK